MAFKISTTEIISDSPQVQNADYNNLHPAVAAPTDLQINFNNPITTKTLTGIVTGIPPNIFTLVNGASGKVCTLLLTRNGYTIPSNGFSGITGWANGITPTWNAFPYWEITFTYWPSAIRAVAVGYST